MATPVPEVAEVAEVAEAPEGVPEVAELSEFPGDDSDNVSLSSYGTDYTSLKSGVLNYEYDNGRRYQSYRRGAYLFPNDEDEQDRMDFLHHIYGMIFGGRLHLAPLKNFSGRVLDLGTGTGIWAMDFADEYPASHVIGNDLSPIQPGWVPPNCIFEVDDFAANWEFNQPFEFVHGRELCGSVKDMDLLAQQAFDNLKSGGYFELKSVSLDMFSDDNSYEERAPFSQQMCDLVHEASVRFGQPLQDLSVWESSLRAAGFVDIVADKIKIPMSPWSADPKQKEIGRYFQAMHVQAMDSYLPKLFCDVLGWSNLEVTILIARSKHELFDLSIHSYCNLYTFYGRKP
ncbi:hypothetical protein ASPZODRAFT_795024 [Penicilliopsis zonata CBS 506.65]|uniref:Methyltransferase domain-containing protein n=1 Tax=Penicilliopsis zonata CBS 506.65 TaxID=1073090 RepID=A0A1L9SBF0_9EURO|nr:hypothetical protein ASPZODRAFT_795024 [Penicilliopsis zonata CBS 506.65]OJJ44466.1 hypothetical protein ASPZODRAFT_795024 [Penicilliopsis zonata CBS 506.65]